MGLFERNRRERSGPDDARERLNTAREAFAVATDRAALAEKTAAYQTARAAELRSLLLEQSRLALAKKNSRMALSRAETLLSLARKLRERRPPPAPEAAEYEHQESEALAQLNARQDAHANAAAELARIEGEIGRREAELRERFGLPDQE